MQNLSVKECLSFGWKTFTSRPWLFVSATAILFFTGLLANLPQDITPAHESGTVSAFSIIATIVSMLLSFLVVMGKTSFFLKAHDAPHEVGFAALWHPRPYWKFVAASILSGLATILGFILLIVPGIIIGILFSFGLYIVIERNEGPIEALKQSAILTKGNRWKLFLLGLSLLAINILGFCLVLVGLLVSLPISTLAIVHAYRTLSGARMPDVISPPSSAVEA